MPLHHLLQQVAPRPGVLAHRRVNFYPPFYPVGQGVVKARLRAHSSGSSPESVLLVARVPDVAEPRGSIARLVRASSAANSVSSGRVIRYSAAITLFDSPSRAY